MNHVTRRRFLGMAAMTPLAASLVQLSQPSVAHASRGHHRPDVFGTLDEKAEAIRAQYRVPGASTGAMTRNKLLHAEGFGVMEIGRHKEMSPLSVHCLASVSKTFTAAAIMQLVEAGKIDINRPVTTYLPYFELADPRYAQITVRHLMGHMSGLPGLNYASFLSDWYDPWTDDGALERYVRGLKTDGTVLSFDPGTSFDYSDVGYAVLGETIHQVSGELFEHYCERHLIRPLGLSHTTFLKPEIAPGLLTTPHVVDASGNVVVSPVYPYDRKQSPGGCLYSNMRDMSVWVRMFMNGGEYKGHRVFSKESRDVLWTAIMDWGGGSGYGNGWFHSLLGDQELI